MSKIILIEDKFVSGAHKSRAHQFKSRSHAIDYVLDKYYNSDIWEELSHAKNLFRFKNTNSDDINVDVKIREVEDNNDTQDSNGGEPFHSLELRHNKLMAHLKTKVLTNEISAFIANNIKDNYQQLTSTLSMVLADESIQDKDNKFKVAFIDSYQQESNDELVARILEQTAGTFLSCYKELINRTDNQ